MLYRSVLSFWLAKKLDMPLLVIGVYIISLVCCDDLASGQHDIEHVRQDNNKIQQMNGTGNLDVSDKASDKRIQNVTDSFADIISSKFSNNVSANVNQATSNNETESFNNTETDIEHWRTVLGMSILEEHVHAFINNMAKDSGSSAANDSHLALAINAKTDMYTDEFLATLTNDIIDKHYSLQNVRIEEYCIRGK